MLIKGNAEAVAAYQKRKGAKLKKTAPRRKAARRAKANYNAGAGPKPKPEATKPAPSSPPAQ
jgi:hypothetical protein